MATKTFDQQLGERLRAARQKVGISVIELAAKIGCSRQLIYQWENGGRKPNPYHLKLLSKYLKISVDFIVSGG